MVFNIDNVYYEMRSIMINNFSYEKNINKKFNLAKKVIIEHLKEILEDNKKDLIKEVKKEVE